MLHLTYTKIWTYIKNSYLLLTVVNLYYTLYMLIIFILLINNTVIVKLF